MLYSAYIIRIEAVGMKEMENATIKLLNQLSKQTPNVKKKKEIKRVLARKIRTIRISAVEADKKEMNSYLLLITLSHR